MSVFIRNSQMSTHVPVGFQSLFSGFLNHFVFAKLATISIRVNGKKQWYCTYKAWWDDERQVRFDEPPCRSRCVVFIVKLRPWSFHCKERKHIQSSIEISCKDKFLDYGEILNRFYISNHFLSIYCTVAIRHHQYGALCMIPMLYSACNAEYNNDSEGISIIVIQITSVTKQKCTR